MKESPVTSGAEVRGIQNDCFISKYHHKSRALHQHSCIEMIYVIKGEAIHVVKKKTGVETREPLRAGCYTILDFETAHAFENGSNDFFVINFLFQPHFISKSLAKARSFEEIASHPTVGFDNASLCETPVNRLFYDEDRQVLTIFEKAFHAFSQSTPGSSQLVRCYAIEIMIAAMQQLLNTVPNGVADSSIASLCHYISTHYTEDISLSKICRERYFSLPYISKKFKKVCGISFEQYLQQVRVQHACGLLLETNLPVDAIARHVHYSDTAAFRKTFKRLTGKTPSAFRKSYTMQK